MIQKTDNNLFTIEFNNPSFEYMRFKTIYWFINPEGTECQHLCWRSYSVTKIFTGALSSDNDDSKIHIVDELPNKLDIFQNRDSTDIRVSRTTCKLIQ